MAVPAFLRALPPSFEVQRGARGWLAVHASAAAELRELGFGPDGEGAAEASDLAGRTPLGELRLHGVRHLVRRHSHGGLLRWLTGARFADPGRPFRELALAEELRERGVATPRVVAAWARRAAPAGWRLGLVSERVEGAVDLARALRETRGAQRRALIAAAGAAVGELHRHGVAHADLTPRNLLVEARPGSAPPRIWVIDLDRSRREPGLDARALRENLRRLHRHAERLRRERGLVLSRADRARFLRAWSTACRDDWRATWREVQRRHARSAALHGVGWGLERLLGRARSGHGEAPPAGGAPGRPRAP